MALPELELVPPSDPDDDDPWFSPVAVQMALTQVPVQQSLSVVHWVPIPAVTLSGVQVEQSEEMSQPTGQVELQLPELVTVGEQPKASSRVVATVPTRDRSPTLMSHILQKLPPAPYTKVKSSASHWSGIPLEMQALRRTV